MEKNQQFDERWRRIAAVFFRAPAKPSPRETEDFVARVMDRLAAEGAARPPVWLDWLDSRWLIPALSLGFAALLLSIVLPPPESVAPLDIAFLIDSQNRNVGQLVLPPDPNDPDALSGLASEER